MSDRLMSSGLLSSALLFGGPMSDRLIVQWHFCLVGYGFDGLMFNVLIVRLVNVRWVNIRTCIIMSLPCPWCIRWSYCNS